MPIVAGGINFKKNGRNKELIDAIIKKARKEIEVDALFIENDFYNLIAGKTKVESDSERVEGFENKEGLLIGRFFSKIDTFSHLLAPQLSKEDRKKILDSRGEWLSRNYWGRYILILYDKEENSFYLFRDPLGLSSLFYAQIDEGLIFSSELWLIKDVLGQDASFDWEYIASFIPYGPLVTSRTGFEGILEVSPGCFLKASFNNISLKTFWDPTTIEMNEDVSSSHLANIFCGCVSQWMKSSPGFCLQFSGGLDSTALLLTLKQAKLEDKNLIVLNFWNNQVASSDERSFSQTIATQYGIELREHSWENPLSLTQPTQLNCRSSRPEPRFLDLKMCHDLADLVREFDQIEIASGYGGDQLFLAGGSLESIADYFLHKRLNGIMSKAWEFSQLNRCSLPLVLKKTIQDLYKYLMKDESQSPSFSPQAGKWFLPQLKDLINPDLFFPPFAKQLRQAPPGKAKHILDIYHGVCGVESGLKTFGRPTLYPYYSQPLVEAAISIPTYLSYNESYDRIPFRKSISTHFNSDLVWRKSKGDTSGIFQLGLRNNFARARELCLEGRFAQQGLLSKEVLLTQLNLAKQGIIDDQGPLLNLLAAELWFESWE